MNKWLCNNNYTFRLHPKNDNGDYSKPFQNINILCAILNYKKLIKN
jgi:hypothetical protein